MNEFNVSENMIMWAFRYALGRRTGAVDSVINHLMKHWDRLAEQTQNQIKQEIATAVEMKMAGAECDVESWQKVLRF